MLHAHNMHIAPAHEGHSFLLRPSSSPGSPWCHCRGCTLTAALRIRSTVRTRGLQGTAREAEAWVEGMEHLQQRSKPINRGTAAGLVGQARATQWAHQRGRYQQQGGRGGSPGTSEPANNSSRHKLCSPRPKDYRNKGGEEGSSTVRPADGGEGVQDHALQSDADRTLCNVRFY